MMTKHPHQHAVDTALAVAQYLPADPVFWIECAAQAGIALNIAADGELRPSLSDIADQHQATFLLNWLSLTPGGKEAAAQYLQERQPAAA
jgi:hypothetical protein